MKQYALCRHKMQYALSEIQNSEYDLKFKIKQLFY